MQVFFTLYLILFLLSTVVTPFLPLHLLWRFAVIATFALLGALLLQQPVHWSDEGWLRGILISRLSILVLGAVGLIIVRIVFAAVCHTLEDRLFQSCDTSCFLDQSILALIGTVTGIFCTFLLLRLLGGIQGGIWLDIGITFTAVALSGALILAGAERWRTLLIASAGTISLMAFFGTFQTSNILTQAEALAAGKKWCLAAANDEPITSVDQLGYFSLKKGRLSPHLTLNIGSAEQRQTLNWSIRRQKFEPGYTPHDCEPVKNFADKIQ